MLLALKQDVAMSTQPSASNIGEHDTDGHRGRTVLRGKAPCSAPIPKAHGHAVCARMDGDEVDLAIRTHVLQQPP
jgi:hypothetical protein